MGRAPCCEKNGLKKGPWTPEEDQKLIDYVQQHGHGSWRTLPKNAGLARCGKSCRLRWTNYLRPDIKRGRFSFEEEETIIQLHSIMGNKWSAIAARLPGRTDNEIKNYWNTHIRKRLLRMGIDPVTHSPRLDLLDLSSLLNHTLYNQTHHQFDVSRLFGIESLVSPELLRIATQLLSSQCQNPSNNLLHPSLQEPHPASNSAGQLQDYHFPSSFQNSIQDIPACTTSNAQFFNVGQVQPEAQTNAWQDPQCNFSENLGPAAGYMENSVPQFTSENSSKLDVPCSNQNYNLMTSVLSTPASSPTHLNSSSTYINSSTEDERDSYCSELLKFQIPDLLDVTDFL